MILQHSTSRGISSG